MDAQIKPPFDPATFPKEVAPTSFHVSEAARSPSPTPSFKTAETPSLHRVSSEHLLNGAREMEIEHGGSLYRLRLTALGKLILTK